MSSKNNKPSRPTFVLNPNSSADPTVPRRHQPAPKQSRNIRGNFSLGGRRFNGSTTRRGSRH
jgi:hypothetical protein